MLLVCTRPYQAVALADVDSDGDPTVWQLAYFAVPYGTRIYMHFFVTGTDPDEDVLSSFTPEPTTLSLLALGGLTDLRRRKK